MAGPKGMEGVSACEGLREEGEIGLGGGVRGVREGERGVREVARGCLRVKCLPCVWGV